MSYKLLIFDWDGTLMDSEARIVSCIQAASADLELPIPSRDESKNVIGLGLYEAVRTLFPDGEKQLHLKISDRYRHHFLNVDATPSTLFDGVHEMLSELEEQGAFLAVATGKGRQGLDSVLQETELHGRFHATRCADETASKPNPMMLFELLDFFGLDANEALMIGDTEYDLQMAREAKMDALAVSYGVHELERLLAHEPKHTVHNIEEMHHWLRPRLAK